MTIKHKITLQCDADDCSAIMEFSSIEDIDFPSLGWSMKDGKHLCLYHTLRRAASEIEAPYVALVEVYDDGSERILNAVVPDHVEVLLSWIPVFLCHYTPDVTALKIIGMES